ncbi:hypothetical protein E3N88_08619 [Mikania micrantha]|uniref:Uncharacterized protein n=1 Tax=Mikania micrantha TaxID=192012 RepID=A0A5N6PJ06_9ASTR|nr:hypothetical protein E3N88_08619 [Mikania micrantha]
MAIFLPRIIQAKRVLKRSFSNGSSTSTSMETPKGYFAIYVGEEEKRRFVVPVSLLSQPTFQEFGYDHPMGGLTIPCSEDMFVDLASRYGFLILLHQLLYSENTLPSTTMAIFLPRILQTKRVLKRSFSNGSSTSTSMDIPKGYFAIYVGEEEKRRFVVPVSLLSQPAFQELLHLAEEQFGYNHPMGGLTIPCSEDMFIDLASRYEHRSTTLSSTLTSDDIVIEDFYGLLFSKSTLASTKMAIFLPRIIQAKQVLRRSFSNGSSTSTSTDIPKGYFAVYVGEEEKRRSVVPVSLLSQIEFQELLHLAEEQFGYDHPMGGLTIPCSEGILVDLASRYGAL